jgi:hypothetical protein
MDAALEQGRGRDAAALCHLNVEEWKDILRRVRAAFNQDRITLIARSDQVGTCPRYCEVRNLGGWPDTLSRWHADTHQSSESRSG